MSFCYFKKSHIGFFACFFSSWVNCCDLWGWTAVPSNPFCDGFLHIGCASPAASGSVNSCRHTSAKLPTNVDQLAHKCRPCCRHLSAIKTQRPHSIAGAGMRHGLYSGCPQQSLYALSRKGAKNAKAIPYRRAVPRATKAHGRGQLSPIESVSPSPEGFEDDDGGQPTPEAQATSIRSKGICLNLGCFHVPGGGSRTGRCP